MTQAKRRLTDINFEHEGAHVALVGKHQGGPANGVTTLITKATNSIAQDVIEKASTVTVTMQFPEFLRKFFGMYWDDAEVLSAAMGYGRTEHPEQEDMKDWIDDRVQSISIMKAVYRAQDMEKALSELTPDQTLAILKDQEMLEKALEVVPETIIKHKEESPVETILKSAHEEFVAKAVQDAVAVEKAAYAAQEEILKAAQAELEVLKAEKQAAVTKARQDALSAVVAADRVEGLMKAFAALDDEAFAVAVEGFAVQKAAADNSEMFQEAGVQGTGEATSQEEDRTLAILKARYGSK